MQQNAANFEGLKMNENMICFFFNLYACKQTNTHTQAKTNKSSHTHTNTNIN